MNKVDIDIHADALGNLALAYQNTGKYYEAFQLIAARARMRE